MELLLDRKLIRGNKIFRHSSENIYFKLEKKKKIETFIIQLNLPIQCQLILFLKIETFLIF